MRNLPNSVLRSVHQSALVLAACLLWSSIASVSLAQDTTSKDGANEAKSGYLIDSPVPLETSSTARLLAQLNQLSESVPPGERVTVVIRYHSDVDSGEGTGFEDALKIARTITQPELRSLRIVSMVENEIIGHSVLPILASDSLIVTSTATLGDASAGESTADETITLTYKSIAAKRGLFPPAIVAACIDPGLELASVSEVGGNESFAYGKELQDLRKSGKILREETWSSAGAPLKMDAKQLRKARIAAGIVASLDEAAELLDLAKINPIDQKQLEGETKGAFLEIAGSISRNRTRRWQSNLASTLNSNDVNTWLISIDSGGGDIDESASLAGLFAEPEPPLRTVAGFIQGEARGDAALIALACDPLYMSPDAHLGGPGSDVVTQDDLSRYDEMIDQIARSTKRPAALIRGILNPELTIYRYTNKKTGRVRYATEDDLVRDSDDPDTERDRWQRGDEIELGPGLTAAQAVELGLINGESQSLEDASRRLGLSEVPKAVSDKGFVRFVEKLGRSQGLAFLLLFVGFVTLSAEANAPGVSVPGFISLVCFALYFWIKFLAGTAEWLELVLFAVGLICIAIEIFVIPGFGVFGVGGLVMVMMGLVLMSQTFVVPKNTYQIGVLTRGIWIALGGVFGMVGGFVAVRMLFPHIPFFNGLVMEAPDAATVGEAEKLADYAYLASQTGITTTKLMPSGKARFGDDIVAVVSEGSAVPKGASIRVIEVQGNRIVVEETKS